MPDRDVKTIRDLIFYQYAKIVARRAFSAHDGRAAKAQSYGFIKKTFKELQAGAKRWSEITREDWQLVESDHKWVTAARKGTFTRNASFRSRSGQGGAL